jgi:hypothetical protein
MKTITSVMRGIELIKKGNGLKKGTIIEKGSGRGNDMACSLREGMSGDGLGGKEYFAGVKKSQILSQNRKAGNGLVIEEKGAFLAVGNDMERGIDRVPYHRKEKISCHKGSRDKGEKSFYLLFCAGKRII